MNDEYFCWGCRKYHKGEPASVRNGRATCPRCHKNFTPDNGAVAKKRARFNNRSKEFRAGKLDWLKYT